MISDASHARRYAMAAPLPCPYAYAPKGNNNRVCTYVRPGVTMIGGVRMPPHGQRVRERKEVCRRITYHHPRQVDAELCCSSCHYLPNILSVQS